MKKKPSPLIDIGFHARTRIRDKREFSASVSPGADDEETRINEALFFDEDGPTAFNPASGATDITRTRPPAATPESEAPTVFGSEAALDGPTRTGRSQADAVTTPGANAPTVVGPGASPDDITRTSPGRAAVSAGPELECPPRRPPIELPPNLPRPVPANEMEILVDWMDENPGEVVVPPGFSHCAQHMGQLYRVLVRNLSRMAAMTRAQARQVARAIVISAPGSNTRERELSHRLRAANRASEKDLKERIANPLMCALLDRVRLYFGKTFFGRFALGFGDAVEAAIGADYAHVNNELGEILKEIRETFYSKGLNEHVAFFLLDDEVQDIVDSVLYRIKAAYNTPGFQARLQGEHGLPDSFVTDLIPVLLSSRPSGRINLEAEPEAREVAGEEPPPMVLADASYLNTVCMGNHSRMEDRLFLVLSGETLRELKCNNRLVRRAVGKSMEVVFAPENWHRVNMERAQELERQFKMEDSADDLLSIALHFQLMPLLPKPDAHFFESLRRVLVTMLGEEYLIRENFLLAPIRNEYHTREINLTDWAGFLRNPAFKGVFRGFLKRLKRRFRKKYPKATPRCMEMADELGGKTWEFAEECYRDLGGALDGEAVFLIRLLYFYRQGAEKPQNIDKEWLLELLFDPLRLSPETQARLGVQDEEDDGEGEETSPTITR